MQSWKKRSGYEGFALALAMTRRARVGYKLGLEAHEQSCKGSKERHHDCKTEEHRQRLVEFLGVEIAFFHRLHTAGVASGRIGYANL